ncbi:MAG: hypothetical protein R2876_02000 [Eubacteriales bacterium]
MSDTELLRLSRRIKEIKKESIFSLSDIFTVTYPSNQAVLKLGDELGIIFGRIPSTDVPYGGYVATTISHMSLFENAPIAILTAPVCNTYVHIMIEAFVKLSDATSTTIMMRHTYADSLYMGAHYAIVGALK